MEEGINSDYHKGFLYSVFLLQILVTLINFAYIFASLPIWAIRDFYPLRVSFLSIMLSLSASALSMTLWETIQLARGRLPPHKFLRHEILKAAIWLTWASLVGLCLATVIEYYPQTAAYLSAILYGMFLVGFISLLPYAAVMYHREKKWSFDVDPNNGWKYEDGRLIRKTESRSEDENSRENSITNDTQPDAA